MTQQPRAPKAPRIDRARPPDRVGDAGSVRSGDTRDGESIDGAGLAGSDLDFTGVHLVECELRRLDVPVFAAWRSSWRSVEVAASRLGSAELYESTWRSVVVADAKINYLNARSATWTDVVFRNCTISELDLGHAKVSRMALQDCEIGSLDVTGARLLDVDLRTAGLSHLKGLAGLAGTWVSEDQLTRLAPLLADHLGIQIG